MQLNEPDLAIEYYLKAIKLPPKHANWRWYHSGIGRAYLRRNEAIKALPYLQKGIEGEFDQDLGGAYYFICAGYTNIGDYEKAEVYGRKAVAESFCYGIGAMLNCFPVQGRFREVLQFVNSICHEVQCEQVCSHFLFRTSMLLSEFEKAEQFFINGGI